MLTLAKTLVLLEEGYDGHCTELVTQLQKHFRRAGHVQTSEQVLQVLFALLGVTVPFLLGAKGSICTFCINQKAGLSGQQCSASDAGDLHFWSREEVVPM